ncbi:MAG: alpha-L-fucosidase [Sedimentisphaerales bacterium]|nr:alpha-L-fucosidase [Sedimentisphaerales bacterium]
MKKRSLKIITGSLVILSILCTLAKVVQAEPYNPNTDWFMKAGYGVFVCYLEIYQNDPARLNSFGKKTSWDQCVREFDTEKFADQMEQAGAGYVIFTMQQNARFLIAPNATFDRLTGYKPGEACATRDLVEDLYKSLHPRGIKLILYWTGDGPRKDPKAAAALKYTRKVNETFVTNWSNVAREYGERYKEKVVGWWVDGCYTFIGYDQKKLEILAKGLKAGNPKRIIALNLGVKKKVSAYSEYEDYTCGEKERFDDYPSSRWINGEQWHILSYLSCEHKGWGSPGTRYKKQELIDYVNKCNSKGGVVSIDVMLYRDGLLDRSQLEMLKALRAAKENR